MKRSKLIVTIVFAALTAALLVTAASAAYPSSDADIPAGSALITGNIIGEKSGWDGTTGTGRSAAFDGSAFSYYDPTTKGESYTYCGIDAGENYILTKVMILPRDGQLVRFRGATIQGSEDQEEWVTLFHSDHGVGAWEWQEIEDFDNNTGYRYFRYWNGEEHGDVAEVEFYGYAAVGAGAVDVKLTGTVIGEAVGWGGNASSGAAAL